MLELRDGTRKSWQTSFTQTGLHTTHKKWSMHSWSTFGAKTNHEQHGHIRLTTARTWGEATTFPLIVYYVASHEAYIQMAFLSRDSWVGVPKSCQLGLSQLWSPITLRPDLGLRYNLKQSCSSCWELSNGILHALYSQVNRVNSRLLWSGVKLVIWLLALLLAITCVLDIQMSNLSPF